MDDATLLARALATPPPPRLRLSPQGFDLIAEVKLRSPALGKLRGAGRGRRRARDAVRRGGAAAVSVLTEPSRFDGSLEHLQQAARALLGARAPAMRKDFLVDPYQVIEARAAGAGGVLVILRMMPRAAHRGAAGHGRAAADCSCCSRHSTKPTSSSPTSCCAAKARALAADAPLLVGVNCRDLVTLQVVPGRLEELARAAAAHARRAWPRAAWNRRRMPRGWRGRGYDLALVGSALMKSADPGAPLVREFARRRERA